MMGLFERLRSIQKLLCRLQGHDWRRDLDNPYRRSCSRCHARGFLMEKRFTAIGEPKYFWSSYND